jgi:DNA-binding HxlR family transcriptional regulator
MFFNRINEMKGGRAQPSRAWRHRKNVRNRFMLLTHLEWLLQSFEEQFVSSPDLEGCLRVSPATAVARRFTFRCTDFDREQLFLDPLVANRRIGITFICWHIPCAAPAWARISSEKETGVKTSFSFGCWQNGPIRYGALRKSVNGMSARVLTERLRTPEAEGLMFRHCKPTIPLAVTYRITDRMKDIEKVWVQLENLSRKCRPEESTARGSTAHSAKAD